MVMKLPYGMSVRGSSGCRVVSNLMAICLPEDVCPHLGAARIGGKREALLERQVASES
jgi:hypothetical protein